MQLDDGFQISEILPGDDGSLSTALYDQMGTQVGTISRLVDGSTQASLPTVENGYDWSGLLNRVSGFLNSAASTAQGVANQATRINRGIQGASAGAKAGYSAPLDWKPWAIAAGATAVAVVAIAAASGSSSSRRRRS